MENVQLCENSTAHSQTKKNQKGHIKKYLKLDKIGNTTYINVWIVVQVVLIGKFITL